MKNLSVLFIDSGIGGISIWDEFIRIAPNESTVYIGDQANFPYGDKKPVFIRNRIVKILKKAAGYDIKLAVIACNAATVSGIEYYRKKFPGLPILGVVPVIKTAVNITRTNHIAILSTGVTAGSTYQQELIKKYGRGKNIYAFPCSGLADLIEWGEIKGKRIQENIGHFLNFLKGKPVDTVVLGCTHYPLIKGVLKQVIGDKAEIIDSGPAVARHILRILKLNHCLSFSPDPSYTFYTTGNPGKVSDVLSGMGKKNIRFKKINIA